MTNQEFISKIIKNPEFYNYTSDKILPAINNDIPLEDLVNIYNIYQSVRNGGHKFFDFKQFLQLEASRMLRISDIDSELAYCNFSLVKDSNGDDCIRFEVYKFI